VFPRSSVGIRSEGGTKPGDVALKYEATKGPRLPGSTLLVAKHVPSRRLPPQRQLFPLPTSQQSQLTACWAHEAWATVLTARAAPIGIKDAPRSEDHQAPGRIADALALLLTPIFLLPLLRAGWAPPKAGSTRWTAATEAHRREKAYACAHDWSRLAVGCVASAEKDVTWVGRLFTCALLLGAAASEGEGGELPWGNALLWLQDGAGICRAHWHVQRGSTHATARMAMLGVWQSAGAWAGTGTAARALPGKGGHILVTPPGHATYITPDKALPQVLRKQGRILKSGQVQGAARPIKAGATVQSAQPSLPHCIFKPV